MSEAEDARREVASERVANILAARILDGSLPPGTRIRQDELAEELGASRIPVREALRILSSRGLVTLRANVGAWVSQMTLQDLGLSYKVRERIEPLLLAESMPRLTDADLDHMESLQQQIEENDDVEEFLRLDRELHWTSYRGHDAPQLADMVHRLWDTTQHYRRAFVRLARSQGSWVISAEHRLLLQALRAGDEETAGTVLTMHIRRTRLALADHPELFAASDSTPG
ncbi:GntR family transcriptional regulator [Nocardioides humi]|uniref:GntR family transcriptional regulator n=1 Tax=Nocardioides humi TaxID=449461 RepID=A0ABN2BSF4_9ACTN|nr:GntR family transcriptional regulator [Nocardioides humi]